MFPRLGVVTGLAAPQATPLLIAPLFRSYPPKQVSIRQARFPFDDELLARYRVMFVAVDDVRGFLSDTTLRDQPFPRGIASVLLLFGSMLALAFTHVAYPAQMLLLGSCHVPLRNFSAAADLVCADLQPTLDLLPTSMARPRNAAELLEELSRIVPMMQPLAAGPIVLTANGTLFVDLSAAAQRLYSDLEAPVATGEVANYRSKYFEIGVQNMIDRTSRAPSEGYRALRGRTLRIDGAAVTDVDAIAETNTHVLLVSCKSTPYTGKYDMGEYRAIRNALTLVVREVSDHQRKVERLNQQLIGDNYQFAKPLAGVVCTPHAVLVPIGPATEEVLPGLRVYVSASELGRWCLDGVA